MGKTGKNFTKPTAEIRRRKVFELMLKLKKPEEISKELGIPIKTIYNYQQNPDFRKLFQEYCDEHLESMRPAVDNRLLKECIEKQNVSAMNLYYKLIRKLDFKGEIEITHKLEKFREIQRAVWGNEEEESEEE